MHRIFKKKLYLITIKPTACQHLSTHTPASTPPHRTWEWEMVRILQREGRVPVEQTATTTTVSEILHSKTLRCSLIGVPCSVFKDPSLNLSPVAKNPSLSLSPERGETFAYRIELNNMALKAPPILPPQKQIELWIIN